MYPVINGLRIQSESLSEYKNITLNAPYDLMIFYKS